MATPNTEAWGLGSEPFPEDVPVGVRGVDQFGNRTVTLATPLADGTKVLVEGIGTGVNHGKPDGQWWPANPALDAGPTNADPWVSEAPQPPEVDANPDGTTVENPETLTPPVAPSKPTTSGPAAPFIPAVVVPSATIAQDASTGTWWVREWHATGKYIESEFQKLEEAVNRLWSHWFKAHR